MSPLFLGKKKHACKTNHLRKKIFLPVKKKKKKGIMVGKFSLIKLKAHSTVHVAIPKAGQLSLVKILCSFFLLHFNML